MGVIYRNEQHSGRDVTTQTLPRVLGLTAEETQVFNAFVNQRPRPYLCVCPVCQQTFGKGERALLVCCSAKGGEQQMRLVHDNDRLPSELSLIEIYSGLTSEEELRDFKEILFENIAAHNIERAGASRNGEDFKRHRREHSAPRKQLPEKVPVGSR